MRKHQRKLILQLLNTIEEAQAAGLYTDCQEGAVAIGDFIKSVENNGIKTISLLEDYCDLLKQASIEADDSDMLRKLREHLGKIETSVKTELPIKIEIVFFPYKLSMWDSLESIYLAAKADPRCDVYVVPIPYYDKATGNIFAQMHYEGDEYPDYVKITNWREYDVESRQPDVAYIHNAYNNTNIITSVHPYFYSSRLSQFVKNLVYVPYQGMCSKNHLHFISDLFTHINVVVAATYENADQFSTEKIESEIVALGTPKVDRALKLHESLPAVPKEWQEKFGAINGRPIVLVNSSLTNLLHYNEAFFEVHERFFNIFNRRKDLLFVWRPHPLLMTTLSCMLPQMQERYNRLTEIVSNSDFGIIDQDSDSAAAISVPDVLTGDMNSGITPMFALSGKPMFALSFDMSKPKAVRDNQFVYHECDTLSFETFLNRIISGQIPRRDETQITYYKSLHVNSDGSCGEKIHHHMMQTYMED